MAVPDEPKTVEVAVVVIVRGGKILAVHNPRWGAYTLPMTKRRSWQDPQMTDGMHVERWEDAAVRARSECVAGTTTDVPELSVEVPEYQQSDRDGKWKRFSFNVYKMTADDATPFVGNTSIDWLTADEFLDEGRRPISKTARDLIRRARAEAVLMGQEFP